jgi:Ser/Thr protein kinase RdoA (MazF antagonist)
MGGMTHFEILKRIDLTITPHKAAAKWRADPGSLQLVHHGINVIYRFRGGGQDHFLKLTHADLKSAAELEANWDFVQHLAEEGAPVSPPVLSMDRRKVVTIPQGEEVFLATVTQAMPGDLLPERMLPPETFRAWGKALARMQRASATFKPADASLYLDWKRNWDEIRALLAPSDTAALSEYKQVDAWFQSLSQDTQEFGLTHADFRAGNMLLHEGRITIIDFDEPVRHWWAADVARPLLDLLDHPRTERLQARGSFVAGYRSVRPLDEFWVEKLTWFMRMKALGMYSWSAAHWDARQDISRQAWVGQWQKRFAQAPDW